MPNAINIGTKSTPLEFALALSQKVKHSWESGEMLEQVSQVSADLLRFWFDEVFCDTRSLNFHIGQKQSILNTIYCHEVLKAQSVLNMYEKVAFDMLNPHLLQELNNKKYAHPKYCIKMATGTGKTWVLNALLIWQYLNALHHHHTDSVKFSKNFLIVAPGLIVYERLIDSFCGKETSLGKRDFSSSDIAKNRDLFLPPKYAQSVLSFIQNAVVEKQNIGTCNKSEGMIAITNWHLLIDKKEQVQSPSPLDNTKAIINDLLPITPGVSAGHSLEILDSRFKGDVLGFLAHLEHICVFNDEAHHIHENKSANQVNEVEWQESLNLISKDKGQNFLQIDFSATPYNTTGSGQKRTKHYFAHIVSDFRLKEAIEGGLVKLIAIDKRKEFATLANEELDFKAIRDESSNEVLALSEGQRLMLRAGLSKLKLLDEQFMHIDSTKHPKMLVICEDTNVAPKVCEFLQELGLSEDEIMRIDSDKKGEVGVKEWKDIKQRLFNIDKSPNPKVIVSVLMLREGFDVNNICVIVPLRSSNAPILLEQVVGRGLRLMWRESDYIDIKNENRQQILQNKQAPRNYYDILSIIQHPRYEEFYEDLDKEILINQEDELQKESVLGDIINVGLKEGYQRYDMYIPKIITPKEEFLKPLDSMHYTFKGLNVNLAHLKEQLKNYQDESFVSQELTIGTKFGEYKVSAHIFNAQNYNEFLLKIAQVANTTKHTKGAKSYPLMQVDTASLVRVIDRFIRQDLFQQSFNPLENGNWRILMFHRLGITEHILRQINEFICEAQNHTDITSAEIKKEYFSQVSTLKMREKYALHLTKSIYEKTAYPSNKGIFEKDFMLFCDKEASVDKIIKIEPNAHHFAGLQYIRTDGNIATYFADFLCQCKDRIYMIETKANKDINNDNVKQKRKCALDFCEQINELDATQRMNAIWSYHILDDKTFYILSKNKASLEEILRVCELNAHFLAARLF